MVTTVTWQPLYTVPAPAACLSGLWRWARVQKAHLWGGAWRENEAGGLWQRVGRREPLTRSFRFYQNWEAENWFRG